jgi:hypothetical protein
MNTTINTLIEVHRRDGLDAALALAETWAAVEVAGAFTDYVLEDANRSNWPTEKVGLTFEQFEASMFADACTWDAAERQARIIRTLGSIALAELKQKPAGGAA